MKSLTINQAAEIQSMPSFAQINVKKSLHEKSIALCYATFMVLLT